MSALARLALIAVALLLAMPALAQQKGTLAPGASVEVATDADSFTSFSFWHDAKQTAQVQIVGVSGIVAVKVITIEPNQRVGYAGKYAGKKITIVNKSDVAVSYDVN